MPHSSGNIFHSTFWQQTTPCVAREEPKLRPEPFKKLLAFSYELLVCSLNARRKVHMFSMFNSYLSYYQVI